MTDFTVTDVVAKIRSLAAARPEFTYDPPENLPVSGPTCHYVHETNAELVGGCIVGKALLSLGVDAVTLHEYDGGTGANGSTVIIETLGEVIDRPSLDWIDSVQNQQDNGKEWQQAVDYADANYPL